MYIIMYNNNVEQYLQKCDDRNEMKHYISTQY